MRVLLAFLQALRPHPVAPYQHWECYMKNGMKEAGHSWVEATDVDWAEALSLTSESDRLRWRERSWSRMAACVRRALQAGPIDLFLAYLYPHMVDMSAIWELRRLGIPCVNFFCDNVREFREAPKEYACFNLNWVPEYQAIPMYRKAGFEHIHAPMPCWVSPELRSSDHPETEGVTFLGSPDEFRLQILAEVIGLGADIRIYGPGWDGQPMRSHRSETSIGQFLRNQVNDLTNNGLISWLWKFERRFMSLPKAAPIPVERLGGKLTPDEFVRIMQQSTVTIGINRVAVRHRSLRRPVTYSRLRDIEAPMMGACYLTEWAEDLEHLYEPGVEIETYRNVAELKEKLDVLQGDPKKRKRMRRLAQSRSLSEHSVGHTVDRICQRLGLIVQ